MAPSDKSPAGRPLPYVIALLLLPVLVLWRHDDPLYTPLWQSDPWFYFGYFHNLANFKRDLFPNFYYGSRLAWLLPGYLAHHLLSPVAANALLHLGTHCIGVLSLFDILRRTLGVRSAYLTAMVLSLYPWYWAATGWDHVNGAAIAYFLLSMALLTRAAERPGRRWMIFFAGVTIAGAVHTHLFQAALAPFLLLHYAAFAWLRRGRESMRALPAACGWLVAGAVVLTVPLCVVNYLFADGSPWFWAPSLHTAQAVTQNYIWTESLWYEDKLVPYLWFITAAAAAALALFPLRWKSPDELHNPAGMIFSTQLLLATALMIFLQGRGLTLLGHYYYACYLFPFAFPVLGASLWTGVDGMSKRTWIATCCAATLVFALVWVEPPANKFLVRWITEFGALSLIGCLVAVAMVLRRRSEGAWLGLAGLALLAFLTYDGSYRWVPVHGTRSEYERVVNARRLIEEHRENAPVQFWYDKTEPAFHEYFALNASYLAEFARIGESFPQGCKSQATRGALVVVSSRREHTRELAVQALADCWRGSGLKPAIQATQDVDRPGQPFQIVVLKAVSDFSVERPMRVDFAPSGIGRLQFVENPTELVPLPLPRWTAESGASLHEVDGGLTLITPKARTAYAAIYAPLIVPATSRYRVDMRYRELQGRAAFGAFPADQSRWLASDIFGHATRNGREMTFTLDLNAGDTMLLRMVNSNQTDAPSSIAIKDVYVTAIPGR
jgi:4-amino-4-deoxy-L-arabinose transferase-like glycosyltransferase